MNHDKLYDILNEHQIYSSNDLDAFVHAIVDINESINKIFNEYIASIIDKKNSKEGIQDILWDIREEFRHIVYHIEDAKLTE